MSLEQRLREVVEGTARLYGAKVAFTYKRDYPVNPKPRATDGICVLGRRRSSRPRTRRRQHAASHGRRGFFRSCWKRAPGAFIFVGNGDSAGLHHPAYDFNDEVIPIGTSYWVKLVENGAREPEKGTVPARGGAAVL